MMPTMQSGAISAGSYVLSAEGMHPAMKSPPRREPGGLKRRQAVSSIRSSLEFHKKPSLQDVDPDAWLARKLVVRGRER